jgi:hypothetical protein
LAQFAASLFGPIPAVLLLLIIGSPAALRVTEHCFRKSDTRPISHLALALALGAALIDLAAFPLIRYVGPVKDWGTIGVAVAVLAGAVHLWLERARIRRVLQEFQLGEGVLLQPAFQFFPLSPQLSSRNDPCARGSLLPVDRAGHFLSGRQNRRFRRIETHGKLTAGLCKAGVLATDEL